MDGNDTTNRMKTVKCTKYSKKTTLQNDLNYAHYDDAINMLNLSYSGMQKLCLRETDNP